MSRAVAVLLAVVAAVALALPLTAAAAPKIVFQTKEITFSDVKEGQTLTAEFKFTNQGDLNLIIDKVSPSCGCTVAEFDKVTPPGKQGVVTLKLDTTGITGSFRKTAVVSTNDPAQPFVTLVMLGETRSRIKSDKGRRLDLVGCLGEHISTSTILRDAEGGPLFIAAVDNPMKDYLEAKLTPLPGGKEYKLTVTAKSKVPVEFAGPLFLKVPGAGRVSLFVVVEVRGPFTVQPRDLYFGALRKGVKSLTRSILVRRACAKTLKIDKLSYNRRHFVVKQTWLEPNEQLLLEIRPLVQNMPKGSFSEVLAIQSGNMAFKVGLKGVVR